MKRVFFVLMFLMMASGVLAMSEPVTVKTQPGDWVKVYAWPVGIGPLLNLGNGTADENGTFETTFFSLNVEDVMFTVFVIRGQEKIRDVDFLDHNISEPLNIDCRGVTCEKVEEIVEEIVVEEIVVVEDNETIIEGENKISEFILTGKAIFVNNDGSLSLVSSFGGFAVLLLMALFVVGMMRNGKSKVVVLDEDEKELEDMESKVKETADKIQSVKEKKMRWKKIEEAKKKLAEEERELKELEEGGSSEEVEKQEAVVEKAGDRVDDVTQGN